MPLYIDQLTKRYGDRPVLEGFSLELPDRGVVALMGPSGCGKTTLLRLLAGLEQPDGGNIRFPENLRLSMVFQEERLLEVLTARDNILAVLAPEQYPAAMGWLEKLGLADAANLYPRQMSGGMRRRLAIARAMAYGGDLLLLDEPFQALDEGTKEQVMAHVFAPAQRLTVFVTHDRTEAEQAADQVIFLEGPPLAVCR